MAHGQLPGLLFDVEQAEKSQRVVIKGSARARTPPAAVSAVIATAAFEGTAILALSTGRPDRA